jgi:large subunit ribosomal protein L25
MKTTQLKAQARADLGKRFTKQLRKSDQVPGVIYDNSAVTHIVLDQKELAKAVYTAETYIVQLDIEGTRQDAIIREIQFHPVTERMLHIDFLSIAGNREVDVMLPIHLVGTPVGVAKGGKLTVKLRKLKVKGVPSKLPDYVEVDVSGLGLGATIKVGDIKNDVLTIMSPASTALASVEIPRSLRGTAAEAGAEEEEAAGEGVE